MRAACVRETGRARSAIRTCMVTAERVDTGMGIMVGANATEDEAMDSMGNESWTARGL